jgi:hypothetical protein
MPINFEASVFLRHNAIEGGLFVSHVVSVKTKIYDAAAVTAACRRLALPAPIHGTAKLFSGELTGLLVNLPEWQYPVVIDLTSGVVRYDDFEGRWGERRHLDRFLQLYAVEKAKIEANRRGHSCLEQQLADGTIKLQILETT